MEDNSIRLEEIVEKENHTKLSLRAFDRRLMHVEEMSFHTSRAIQNIQQMLSLVLTQMVGSDTESSPEATPKGTPTQRVRHLAFIQDREETAKIPLEAGLTPDEQNKPLPTIHTSRKLDHFRSFSMDRTAGAEWRSSILKRSGSFAEQSIAKTQVERLKRPAVLEQLQSAKSKKSTDPKAEGLTKSKSPKKSRLSTFERYASMVEQQSPVRSDAEPMPIKRQVGFQPRPSSTSSGNLLEPRLQSHDSDSNLSTYSFTSMKNSHRDSMPRSTPYMSAPVYSTITDHIEVPNSQLSNRWSHLVSANTSVGYLTLDDNITSFDGEVPTSPLVLPQGVNRASPISDASSHGGLQQAEHHCFEMMEDVMGDERETQFILEENEDIDAEDEDAGGGIEFTVQSEVNILTNRIGNSVAETAF